MTPETAVAPTTLRLATAGAVDDGKSTLIGRLLYDAKSIMADQLDALAEASRRRGGEDVLDLALLTDGLRAEREQGITIDVAYRYFATPRRRFILADTPGHAQYTRNMATGASTAELAIVLVDARRGVDEQTKRHAFLAGLLGIRHLVLAVNKMDLVGYAEATFDAIVADFAAFAVRLPGARPPAVTPIPLSALRGDNVVERSEAMPWYAGPALLEHLEVVDVGGEASAALRLPVQWVVRDPASGGRGYAGRVEGGEVRPGDEVVVLPTGTRTRIASVELFEGPVDAGGAGRSVTVRLEDELDVSRGDVLCHPGSEPSPARAFSAQVCWFSERPARAGARYVLKHSTTQTPAVLDAIEDALDVATLTRRSADGKLLLNDIGTVRLRTARPLAADPYAANRATGAFILLDEGTGETLAAGMIGA